MINDWEIACRCNLAVILLTDLVVDGLDLDCHSVDWSVHVPLMLHIIFLGLDNSRELVYKCVKAEKGGLLIASWCICFFFPAGIASNFS